MEWAEWPTPRLEFLTYWNHDPQQFVWTKTVNDIIIKVKPYGLRSEGIDEAPLDRS